ncbi:reverse transcriptase-like protein [Chloroflexota bacterium]
MVINILVDSSTKPTSLRQRYGESTAAWAMWNSATMNEPPIRCGINYFKHNGPNKTFYEGIIRALEQCLDYCRNDEVIIKGDCQCVIQQLNKEWKVVELEIQYRQVKALVSKYEKKQNQVKFQYIGESDPVYSKVDQLAKRGRGLIHNNLCR